METLPLIPNNSNYGVQRGEHVQQINLPGGKPRTRAAYSGSWSIVDVEWLLDPCDYQFLEMFYETELDKGVASFEIELILGKPTRELHEAVFVKDSLSLDGQRGLGYFVSAQLYVKPKAVNHELNRLAMMLYRGNPKDPLKGFKCLEQLANFKLKVDLSQLTF